MFYLELVRAMQLDINLHNNFKGYYNAGETVVGCVIVTFQTKLSVKGILYSMSHIKIAAEKLL